MSCPWESSSAHNSWMPIEVGSFGMGRKKRGKIERQKEKIFASRRASWIWVSGESLQWLKLTWYWAKPGGAYQKRFSLLLSICETTPGAPQPLLSSPAQKKKVLTNWPKCLITGGRPVRPLWSCSIKGMVKVSGLLSQPKEAGMMHYNSTYPFSPPKGNTAMNEAHASPRYTAKGQ